MKDGYGRIDPCINVIAVDEGYITEYEHIKCAPEPCDDTLVASINGLTKYQDAKLDYMSPLMGGIRSNKGDLSQFLKVTIYST